MVPADPSVQPGLGDRVSVSAALALRPLAPIVWRGHDSWVARFLYGVGVELGVRTFAGRLSLTATGNAHSQWPTVDVDLGYPF